MLKDADHLDKVKRLRVSDKNLLPLLPHYEVFLSDGSCANLMLFHCREPWDYSKRLIRDERKNVTSHTTLVHGHEGAVVRTSLNAIRLHPWWE